MHVILDKYSVMMAAMLLRNGKWFRESVESPVFQEHFSNTALTLPEIKGEGFYEVEADSLVGTLDPAFHVAKWLGPDYPTIIYHHGNNEQPFNYGVASKNTFKLVCLAKKDMFKANLISIRAPYHNKGMKFYLDKVGKLTNFTAMLAGSVKVAEELVQNLKSSGSGRIMITGVSLGGWVTNLHRSFYNSADVYVPIFAGAALDELFSTSYYKKLAGALVKENPDALRKVLNFETEFTQITDENIFPLLARFDQIIEYERQKRCYGKRSIKVINKGHITGVMASNELRTHILANM